MVCIQRSLRKRQYVWCKQEPVHRLTAEPLSRRTRPRLWLLSNCTSSALSLLLQKSSFILESRTSSRAQVTTQGRGSSITTRREDTLRQMRVCRSDYGGQISSVWSAAAESNVHFWSYGPFCCGSQRYVNVVAHCNYISSSLYSCYYESL